MVEIDRDAVLWSAPERERAGRPLLVLLHGYGSHEGDLFGLSPALPLEPVIASLRAPLQGGPGYSWFAPTFEATAEETSHSANLTASAILDWLNTTTSSSVSILGFSQGGAMALQLLRLAPERFGSATVLAGFVLDGDEPGDSDLAIRKPPVFWGRGTDDRVISHSFVEHTATWLPEHATATVRIYEDLAHSISNQEARDVASFIRGVST